MAKVGCDRQDCGETLEENEMIQIDGFVICPECYDNLENSTGYCGISCRLGYGCDQSC